MSQLKNEINDTIASAIDQNLDLSSSTTDIDQLKSATEGTLNSLTELIASCHTTLDQMSSGAGSFATTVAWFWGLMSIGCLLGLVIVKLIDSKLMLRIFSMIAILNLAIALFGPTQVAIIAFACCGFSISIMFSVIFALALNSVDKHHGAFSGILCTGIFGGALIPFIIGGLGDLIGLRYSMFFLFITLGYILSISYWAKPLVKNETVSLKELLKQLNRTK